MRSQIIETVATSPARSGARTSRAWGLAIVGIALGDAIAVAISFALAYALRFWGGWEIFREGDVRPEFYAALTGILVCCWLSIFILYGLYNRHNLFGGTQEYIRIFNSCTLSVLAVVVITFLVPDFVIARAWLLMSWAFTLLITILWRFITRRLIYTLRRHGHLIERAVVIGANAEGQAVASQLCATPSAGIQIVGFVDDNAAPGSEVMPGIAILGPVSAFQLIIQQQSADVVIIADTTLVRDRLALIYGAMEAMRQLDVRLSPGLFELLTIGVQVREQGSVPLLALNKTRITGLHAVTKSLMDRLGALVGIIVLCPLFTLIALLIWREDGGPVIYRRHVVGAGSQIFDAFKFRTMRRGGEALLSPEQRQELLKSGKLKEDPRITRVGGFLRRTSIDELPQLMNVLLGQMSLVGPRMLTQEELHHFGRWQHNLLTVRPGLTGLWQISGRSNLGYEDRVRLDMQYIRNHSIWLDLYIIYRTIPTVIAGRGAY
jgi:exopolysaccharide biosynthesis polyprenyl glycosylphosphotransferase